MMEKKKTMYIRNNIVFDPNIEPSSVFDFDYEDTMENKRIYRSGKTKRKIYRGK